MLLIIEHDLTHAKQELLFTLACFGRKDKQIQDTRLRK